MRRSLGRAAQLAGLAREVARRRVPITAAPATVAGTNSLVARLAALHGLPQKVGQVLSLGELDGSESVYTALTETPQVMPAAEAFAEMERALERPIQQCFARVDELGVAASLGQVHRARLHDGRQVAVKIQYPGIAETVETDLRALGWLTVPFGGLRRGFDMGGYRREVGAMLREELDYRHEAEMLKRFRSLMGGVPGIEIPTLVEEFSADRILTMSWMDGESFRAVRGWPVEDRRQIADVLLRLFLSSSFSWGLVHADPHPGNYRFRRDGKGPVIGLLDFGCVKRLSNDTVGALRALIEDTVAGNLRDNPRRAMARLEDVGFKPLLLATIEPLLPRLCEILFEPFLVNQPYDTTQWRLGQRVEEVLGSFRWNFRMAGPPALIFFMRAYQGLVQYLSALGTPLSWSSLYDEVVGPCKSEAWHSREDGVAVAARSRELRIRVCRGGRTKAVLVFPAAAAANLLDLIPPEIDPKLAARRIDVAQISRSLAERGFPPGELFHLQEGDNNFRVWLE